MNGSSRGATPLWHSRAAPRAQQQQAQGAGGPIGAASAAWACPPCPAQGACDELETLGQLEEQQLREAEALLKSVGWKGSLFGGGNIGAGNRSNGSSNHSANDA